MYVGRGGLTTANRRVWGPWCARCHPHPSRSSAQPPCSRPVQTAPAPPPLPPPTAPPHPPTRYGEGLGVKQDMNKSRLWVEKVSAREPPCRLSCSPPPRAHTERERRLPRSDGEHGFILLTDWAMQRHPKRGASSNLGRERCGCGERGACGAAPSRFYTAPAHLKQSRAGGLRPTTETPASFAVFSKSVTPSNETSRSNSALRSP